MGDAAAGLLLSPYPAGDGVTMDFRVRHVYRLYTGCIQVSAASPALFVSLGLRRPSSRWVCALLWVWFVSAGAGSLVLLSRPWSAAFVSCPRSTDSSRGLCRRRAGSPPLPNYRRAAASGPGRPVLQKMRFV